MELRVGGLGFLALSDARRGFYMFFWVPAENS